jgi:hypothetical protein
MKALAKIFRQNICQFEEDEKDEAELIFVEISAIAMGIIEALINLSADNLARKYP